MTTDSDDFDLDDAYAVVTPDDNRELYRKWASTYDDNFIDANGYVYHHGVVEAFLVAGGSSGGPVLDVGCGTGVVGGALVDRGERVVDGIDISPEMLEIAGQKTSPDGQAIYRSLLIADLTQPLDIADDVYAGIVSAGIFTHGHLPPEPIRELVRIARPSAVCVLGINAEHYAEQGFGELFAELVGAGDITEPQVTQASIYEARSDAHGGDQATIVTFRLTATASPVVMSAFGVSG